MQLASGARGKHLVYVVAPNVSFPANATNATLPVQQGQQIVLTNWPAGTFFAEWYDPLTGTNLHTTRSATTNGVLALPMPQFTEDLAGIAYAPPRLWTTGLDRQNRLVLNFESETGGEYLVEQSPDLTGEIASNVYDMVIQCAEKPCLEIVLDKAGGNLSRAADMLGINRNTLRKKMQQHGIK